MSDTRAKTNAEKSQIFGQDDLAITAVEGEVEVDDIIAPLSSITPNNRRPSIGTMYCSLFLLI